MTLVLPAMLGFSSSLKNPTYDIGNFEIVMLMTPIWAGNPKPAINKFLGKVDLRGKLALVGTATENIQAANKLTKRVEASSGLVSEIIYLQGPSLTKDAAPLTDAQVKTEAEKIITKLR